MEDSSCGVGNIWETPLLDWRHAVHNVIEGFYASSQRSDWREGKVKQVWKEIAEFSAFSLMGFPWQEVWEVDESGQPVEASAITEELKF